MLEDCPSAVASAIFTTSGWINSEHAQALVQLSKAKVKGTCSSVHVNMDKTPEINNLIINSKLCTFHDQHNYKELTLYQHATSKYTQKCIIDTEIKLYRQA